MRGDSSESGYHQPLGARPGERDDELLAVLRDEIWPLLSDRTPITKGQREEILGYDPATGI